MPQTDSPDKFTPYVTDSSGIREFSPRAIIAGIFFGILFGAANAYLGLLAGLTVSTSIPVAVMTVGLFKLMQRFMGKASILESNISQTTGSASSSLASGVIFTIPALYLWGLDPSLFQMTFLAMLGGLLGILFMIPLRRFLIKEEHKTLPYPEGTACAKVLAAADRAVKGQATNVYLGLGIGMLYKLCIGFLFLWKDKITFHLPVIKKAQVGILATPALLGVGYILGPRIAGIMVAGSLVSWVVLIPLIAHFGELSTVPFFPEKVLTISAMSASEIWNRYIRYVGAGAVAMGGIITIFRSLPTMVRSFKLGVEQFTAKSTDSSAPEAKTSRLDNDLPAKFVLAGVLAIILILAFVPGIIGGQAPMYIRLAAAPLIAIFAFFFVTVSSRIVGLVGVSSNPTSGMTIVTLLGVSLLFVVLGWTDDVGKVTALTVGTVVCVAASIAGDTSQDLKTGFLLGATPRKQQIAELIGAASSALAVCGAIVILNDSYKFGSTELPAPQATLMKTIIEGVLESGIPWGLVMIGALLGVIIELVGLPSLPFAVGLYLPVTTMTPIFCGGAIRYFLDKRFARNPTTASDRRERGILFSSGLIGGEGLLGVGIALYAFFYDKPQGLGVSWPSPLGEFIALGFFALLGFILIRRTRNNPSAT